MGIFNVEVFQVGGTPDNDKRVLKLKRTTIHPGVFHKFIEESGCTVLSQERGIKNHMYVVSTEDFGKFSTYLETFTSETLKTHLAGLRELFPATPKPEKIAMKTAILDSFEGFAGSEDDEDEDSEDGDEDEDDEANVH